RSAWSGPRCGKAAADVCGASVGVPAQVRSQVVVDPRDDARAIFLVLGREDLPLFVDSRDELALVIGHQRGDEHVRTRQLLTDELSQLLDARTGAGGDRDGVLLMTPEPVEHL